MTLARGFFVLLALGLLGLVVWASMSGDIGAEFMAIFLLPWGAVAMADLYAGFFVVGAVILTVERRPAAVAWVVGLFVLGNVVSALWLALRWRTLAERLAAPTAIKAADQDVTAPQSAD